MKIVNIHKLLLSFLLLLPSADYAQAQPLTLQACVDTAQARNKRMQMSRNDVAIGKQKTKVARARLLPKLRLSTDYKYFPNLPYQLIPVSALNPAAPEGEFRAAQFGVPHTINAALRLSVPLYNPQAYAAIRTSEIASELDELAHQKTGEEVYFEVASLYYNAQLLHQQLVFIDSNRSNAKRLLKNTQLLYEQALAKKSDVSKVTLQIAQLKTQKEAISSAYEQVINRLKFTMGIPITREIQIQSEFTYQEPKSYKKATVLAMQIAQKQKLLVSAQFKSIVRSRYLPNVNLLASYGTSGFGYGGAPDSFLDFYPVSFVGVQMAYTLFDGTSTQQKIKQKELELQRSRLQLELLTEKNTMEVENATLERSAKARAIRTTAAQVELAQTIYEQTLLQQQQGTATLTDVLLTDNSLREAQQGYLGAVIDYLKADLKLKKLTGNISINN